ncbi:hypothetical protein LPE509_00377 [Legionella pneumophila subsp. pneumophila LPE509]|nr:hypothetical protein LPE509_00377 [Legionella pneumophila subsp. pneumophila LPE509]
MLQCLARYLATRNDETIEARGSLAQFLKNHQLQNTND